MARARRSDLITRLVDAGEEAVQRLSEVPGGDRVVGTVNAMRDRVDELQKRVRGLENLDRRLTALERKVDKLSRASSASKPKKPKPKP
jgi:polyhydroxyalkanoate synthesis regulator phasin